MHLVGSIAIRPNLQLKIIPKQLLGSLPLDIVLPEEHVLNRLKQPQIWY
jgi:hypothetical protein